ITTNYDRLIEIHAAHANVRVDTMYYGHTIGRLDAHLSREELLKPETVAGKASSIQIRPRPHIRLAKPHGSLDWFSHDGRNYRSELPLPWAQQIIAPGGNKYRLGYEVPFDAQRTRANEAIANASALLFIGYGFNDEHLQTHLKRRFPDVPAVIISKSLTPNALEYLDMNSSAIGIEAAEDLASSLIRTDGKETEIDKALWQIDHLVEEVLHT
ncbi:SIR2 family protein, partial [Dietzia sp. UCD-THP]|uniref:SIR2 family protein n=1 Tax=Dietzia sp. UCD-THP TaxID=1292020 RepID=UPI00187C0AAA